MWRGKKQLSEIPDSVPKTKKMGPFSRTSPQKPFRTHVEISLPLKGGTFSQTPLRKRFQLMAPLPSQRPLNFIVVIDHKYYKYKYTNIMYGKQCDKIQKINQNTQTIKIVQHHIWYHICVRIKSSIASWFSMTHQPCQFW